jgi:hypothetical protein
VANFPPGDFSELNFEKKYEEPRLRPPIFDLPQSLLLLRFDDPVNRSRCDDIYMFVPNDQDDSQKIRSDKD